MLRALIIDDEKNGINSLKLVIEKFTPSVKIVAETTDPIIGVQLIEDYKPEIVFLDVQMPNFSGFDVLSLLIYRDFNLIFTTAHEEYAIKALRENAIDYLLKPIDGEDLQAAIVKVQKRLVNKQAPPDLSALLANLNSKQTKIPFHTKNRIEYIAVKDIIRLESDSNYTMVFTIDGNKLMVSKTIGDYESLLCNDEHQFMRVHQSHIINLKCVKRYIPEDGSIVIEPGNFKVPLSKTKREEFVKWLGVGK